MRRSPALARDFNVQTTTLGVRGELAFASMPLTLKSMFGRRHAFGDVVPSTLLAFQGGAQGFSVAGVPIDRDAFVAEVGIDYAVTSSVRVGISSSTLDRQPRLGLRLQGPYRGELLSVMPQQVRA